MRVLNVGCGNRTIDGAVNLDKFQVPGRTVDVLHDLEVFPYPFADGEFDEIIAEDILEHLNDVIAAVQEFGRMLKSGGTLKIQGPNAAFPDYVWADLTHKRGFSDRSFDGFDPDTWDGRMYGHYHGPIKFKMLEKGPTPRSRNYHYVLRKR